MLREQTAIAEHEGDVTKTISQMSALYDVTLRTLRFYEDKGLLKPTRIGNHRFYTRADELRLQVILKGKHLGFSLFEIERLILAKIDKDADWADLALWQVAAAVLPPAIVQQKIVKLERVRDATAEAISELKQHIRQPTLSS